MHRRFYFDPTNMDKEMRTDFIMKELLAQICFHFCQRGQAGQRGNHKQQAEYMITQGLKEMMRTDKTLIWLIFACQVHLDIRYFLEQAAQLCHEVLETGQRLHKSLTDYIEFLADFFKPQTTNNLRETLLELNVCFLRNFGTITIYQEPRRKLLPQQPRGFEISW